MKRPHLECADGHSGSRKSRSTDVWKAVLFETLKCVTSGVGRIQLKLGYCTLPACYNYSVCSQPYWINGLLTYLCKKIGWPSISGYPEVRSTPKYWFLIVFAYILRHINIFRNIKKSLCIPVFGTLVHRSNVISTDKFMKINQIIIMNILILS